MPPYARDWLTLVRTAWGRVCKIRGKCELCGEGGCDPAYRNRAQTVSSGEYISSLAAKVM